MTDLTQGACTCTSRHATRCECADAPVYRRRAARPSCAAGAAITAPIALIGPGHGLAGLAIAAAALITIATVIALAPELFWLLALRQPSRDLHRLLRQLPPQDAARLSRQLNDACAMVTTARAVRSQQRQSGPPGTSR
jgi:hypothetical protein